MTEEADAAARFALLAKGEGIGVSPRQEEQFRVYARVLAEWNQKMNLTAIRTPEGVAEKHFLDSALVLKFYRPPPGAKAIDVGTGAGFPGVPLKILRPDLRLTLLDSLNKRLVFLAELLRALGLEAELVHARAEEAGRRKEYGGRYAFATARAVARMPVLCGYCLPFLAPGGVFAAMKGPDASAEMESALPVVARLGGSVRRAETYSLPSGDGRTLFLISPGHAGPAARLEK